MPSMPIGCQPGGFLNDPSPLLQLGSALWLDLDSGTVIREQEHILLTAREVHVLRILVQVMHFSRGYLSADAIAQQLHLTEVSDPVHCIEQTISTIRHKFGEIAHHPHILRGRRGLGYRLFFEVPSTHKSSINVNKS